MERALRFLRMGLGVSWKDEVSNDVLYGKLPELSDKIKSRRLEVVRHCIRHSQLSAKKVTWESEAGRGETKRGRPRQSYQST